VLLLLLLYRMVSQQPVLVQHLATDSPVVQGICWTCLHTQQQHVWLALLAQPHI
jgi:hypothetical protein